MKTIVIQLTVLVALSLSISSYAQVLTKEDSLNAGLISKNLTTQVGGYGEAAYRNDIEGKTASLNLTRNVLFIGHKFNNKISLFTETEVEDAKVEGGDAGGEIALEQAFLKFNLNHTTYISAGLFIPRIGIINENHLPTTFNSVARPRLEQKLIPSTWRELGVCLYGSIPKLSGLNYSIGLMNGLSSENFEAGEGIREGRFEGRDASASNLAVTGALLYYFGDFRLQVSGYYGGSAGIDAAAADTLKLNNSTFGTPVALEEMNIQFRKFGIYAEALAAAVQLPDAEKINAAYGKNAPSSMFGYYTEIGYNLLEKTKYKEKKLNLFLRYENFDLNTSVPANGIKSAAYQQSYIFAGLAFLPLPNIIVKADFEFQQNGNPNASLNVPVVGTTSNFNTTQSFVNLGIGYSF